MLFHTVFMLISSTNLLLLANVDEEMPIQVHFSHGVDKGATTCSRIGNFADSSWSSLAANSQELVQFLNLPESPEVRAQTVPLMDGIGTMRTEFNALHQVDIQRGMALYRERVIRDTHFYFGSTGGWHIQLPGEQLFYGTVGKLNEANGEKQKLMAEMHKGIHGLITEYDKNIYQELLYHYVRLKQGIMASPRNPYKHNALLREKLKAMRAQFWGLWMTLKVEIEVLVDETLLATRPALQKIGLIVGQLRRKFAIPLTRQALTTEATTSMFIHTEDWHRPIGSYTADDYTLKFLPLNETFLLSYGVNIGDRQKSPTLDNKRHSTTKFGGKGTFKKRQQQQWQQPN